MVGTERGRSATASGIASAARDKNRVRDNNIYTPCKCHLYPMQIHLRPM